MIPKAISRLKCPQIPARTTMYGSNGISPTLTEVTPAKIGTPCNPTLATASPACAQNQIILGFLRWPVSSGKENVT